MQDDRNHIIITRNEDERFYAAFRGNKVMYLLRETVEAATDAAAATVGAIYTGRIDHIVDNLDAAFVRIGHKENGYLPLKEIPEVFKKNPVRAGMLLPVQIVAPARGSKQVRLTSFLSLTGHQAVLLYGESGVGCSAKLPTETRSFLTEEVRRILKERDREDLIRTHSVIIRTEAANRDAASIVDEALFLETSMREILTKADTRNAGTRLTKSDESLAVTEQFLRLYHYLNLSDPERRVSVFTDDKVAFSILKESGITKDHPELRIEERSPLEQTLYTSYGLNKVVGDMKKRVVYLKSGGFLVIDQTEAMTVIDVNSGKYVKKKKRTDTDIRDTEACNINLEAADELLRQVRIRQLTGIIMVDFINMKDTALYGKLADRIRETSSHDPVRTRFVDFTKLGIAELTRSRLW